MIYIKCSKTLYIPSVKIIVQVLVTLQSHWIKKYLKLQLQALNPSCGYSEDLYALCYIVKDQYNLDLFKDIVLTILLIFVF